MHEDWETGPRMGTQKSLWEIPADSSQDPVQKSSGGLGFVVTVPISHPHSPLSQTENDSRKTAQPLEVKRSKPPTLTWRYRGE